jgi:hypothetical protein
MGPLSFLTVTCSLLPDISYVLAHLKPCLFFASSCWRRRRRRRRGWRRRRMRSQKYLDSS